MTRAVKFRIWDKEEKRFRLDIGLISGGIIELGYGEVGDYDGAFDEVDANNFVVLLSTGLLDKQGKEIFEGDVIRWHEPGEESQLYIVKRLKSINMLYFESQDDPEYNEALHMMSPSSLEVIGNIYENPELLDKEAK